MVETSSTCTCCGSWAGAPRATLVVLPTPGQRTHATPSIYQESRAWVCPTPSSGAERGLAPGLPDSVRRSLEAAGTAGDGAPPFTARPRAAHDPPAAPCPSTSGGSCCLGSSCAASSARPGTCPGRPPCSSAPSGTSSAQPGAQQHRVAMSERNSQPHTGGRGPKPEGWGDTLAPGDGDGAWGGQVSLALPAPHERRVPWGDVVGQGQGTSNVLKAQQSEGACEGSMGGTMVSPWCHSGPPWDRTPDSQQGAYGRGGAGNPQGGRPAGSYHPSNGGRIRGGTGAAGRARGVAGTTYTQVPGVQLHLLLQLREQLVVKGLQLDAERTQGSSQCRRAGQRTGRHPPCERACPIYEPPPAGPGGGSGGERPACGPLPGGPPAETGTHHFFQLILNLPVHLSHLEEDVSCNGRNVSTPNAVPITPMWLRSGAPGARHWGLTVWAAGGSRPARPCDPQAEGCGGAGRGTRLLVTPRRNEKQGAELKCMTA